MYLLAEKEETTFNNVFGSRVLLWESKWLELILNLTIVHPLPFYVILLKVVMLQKVHLKIVVPLKSLLKTFRDQVSISY